MLPLFCSSEHAGMPRGSFCVFVFIPLSFRSASLYGGTADLLQPLWVDRHRVTRLWSYGEASRG